MGLLAGGRICEDGLEVSGGVRVLEREHHPLQDLVRLDQAVRHRQHSEVTTELLQLLLLPSYFAVHP